MGAELTPMTAAQIDQVFERFQQARDRKGNPLAPKVDRTALEKAIREAEEKISSEGGTLASQFLARARVIRDLAPQNPIQKAPSRRW